MPFILPDEVLDKLVCSICGKYLSVKPIKVYSNGQTKCGRCSSAEDDGVVSHFGNVAENVLFPCVNRYEGCQVYLTYSEISDHERKCKPGSYDCPLCAPDEYQSAAAYQLLYHYKTCHKNKVLCEPEFCIDINKECDENFLYRRNNYLYVLYLRRYMNEKYLHLNGSVIAYNRICSSISQKVDLFTIDKTPLVGTSKQLCSLFNNNSTGFKIPLSKLIYKESNLVICRFSFDAPAINNFILLPNNLINDVKETYENKGLHNTFPKIYLSPEFQEAYPDFCLSVCKTKVVQRVGDTKIEFPRICYFCENIFQTCGYANIYKCSKGHFACESCFILSSNCCEGTYVYAEQESDVYNLLYFYCKWNCQRFYCGQDLNYHEGHCRNNKEIYLSKEDLVKKYFGDVKGSYLIKNSNVFYFDEIISENVSKMYVITPHKFNFILHYSVDNNLLRFWFAHDYPLDKYHFLIRIKEKHLPPYTRVNSFTLDPNNRNIICFSVVLRMTN